MAKQFFKDLPDTTTPLNASRLNGLLDGDEALGNIAVDSIRSKNLYDIGKVTLGYYYDSSGNLISSNSNSLSDYIAVDSNTAYTISCTGSTFGLDINEFNSSKTFIKRTTIRSVTSGTITTSANTKFVRCIYNKDNSTAVTKAIIQSANVQLEKSSTATTYSQYRNYDIQDTGWITATMKSGFTNNGLSSSGDLMYRRIGSVVYIKGSVKGFTDVSQTCSTLPTGYRPPTRHDCYGSESSNYIAKFQVNASGDIVLLGGTRGTYTNASQWYAICTSFITDDAFPSY